MPWREGKIKCYVQLHVSDNMDTKQFMRQMFRKKDLLN